MNFIRCVRQTMPGNAANKCSEYLFYDAFKVLGNLFLWYSISFARLSALPKCNGTTYLIAFLNSCLIDTPIMHVPKSHGLFQKNFPSPLWKSLDPLVWQQCLLVLLCSKSLHIEVYILLYCLNATDLKQSQLTWPAARDEMIRLGVWYIPYTFKDVQGLVLASA